jgi:hypothetical protein
MSDRVGPVLEAGELGAAVAAALREGNPDVVIHDRGSYLRVQAHARCVLRREAVERLTGRAFRLPGDLERVMPSFVGALFIDDDQAVWTRREPAAP